jgi:catalase
VVSQLLNVDEDLAAAVAEGLGMELPPAQPAAAPKLTKPEVRTSKALSLFARPGDGSIRTRRIAILVAPGVDGPSATALHEALTAAGAVPRYVAARLGTIGTADGDEIEPDVTIEAAPGVLFDALAIPDGEAAATALAASGPAVEFVKDQYRHCKAILALGAGQLLLEKAQIPAGLPSGEDDPGLLRMDADAAQAAARAFIAAIARHRHFERQTDPPLV